MTTATSVKPRPFIVTNHFVTIELINALPEDLKVFDQYDDNGKKQYRLRTGLIYWLRSELSGIIEPTPYRITEFTDPKELKVYLDKNMILIAKNPFNN